MSASLRKGWCPGALRPMPAEDGLLVRLRITGGILTAARARSLADLAARCGNGLLDLSGRGNLQMRGVRETTLDRLQDGLARLGMLDADARAESVRNVVASPLAGLHGGLDIRPLVSNLEARLAAEASLHALPPKFGFLVDDGSWPSLAALDADVRFDFDGDGFVVGIGGDRGSAMQISWCDAGGLVEEALRISQVFLGHSIPAENRRMRDMDPAILRTAFRGVDGGPRLTANVSASCTIPHPIPADAEATSSRRREKEGGRRVVGCHTYVSLHGEPETASVLGLAAPFGRLNAAMLRDVARLAETTALGELRLTPWRVILVPGVGEAIDLPGFVVDPSDPRLSIAACVGKARCARATTNVPADAADLASTVKPGADIALHVSGCVKGCAKASPTAVTLVGRDGRYDIVRNGRAGDPPWRENLDLASARDLLRVLA